MLELLEEEVEVRGESKATACSSSVSCARTHASESELTGECAAGQRVLIVLNFREGWKFNTIFSRQRVPTACFALNLVETIAPLPAVGTSPLRAPLDLRIVKVPEDEADVQRK